MGSKDVEKYVTSNNFIRSYPFIKPPESQVWHAMHQDVKRFPKNNDVKKIITIHDLNYVHQRKGQSKKVSKYLKNLQHKIDLADKVVFISKYSLSDAQDYLKIPDNKLQIIYNGVALQKVQPRKPKHIKTNQQFIFNINKFLPKKNLAPLIHSIAYLPKEYNLVFAGDHNTNYGKELISLVNELDLSNRITFLGKISEEEKQWLYKNCSLFCFPSLLEGFGLPIVEAQYLGAKTLVSNKTSIPEVAGNASIYIKSFEPEALAIQILNCIETDYDPEIGLKNVRRFSWAAAAESYIKIYRQLMEDA